MLFLMMHLEIIFRCLINKNASKNHPLNIWALHKLLKQCNLGKEIFMDSIYIYK